MVDAAQPDPGRRQSRSDRDGPPPVERGGSAGRSGARGGHVASF